MKRGGFVSKEGHFVQNEKEPQDLDLASQVFESLKGRWSVERSMGAYGSFQGEALFSPDSKGMTYREEGKVFPSLGALKVEPFFAYRDYYYHLEKSDLAIDFRDPSRWGARYVTLNFQKKRSVLWARDTHHCGADVYRHFFFMPEVNRFKTVVCVRGPKKSTALRSVYFRLTH